MATQARKLFSPEEYLALEKDSNHKNEYIMGEIFSMAGASFEHNQISANLTGELRSRLHGSPCQAVGSDMCVRVTETHYVYPDITVVCGKPSLERVSIQTLLNPTLIMEVLSPSTESWDRGGKFRQYQRLESLQEYILVAQEAARVEIYRREEKGVWAYSLVEGLEETVVFRSVHCTVALSAIYERVEFTEGV